MTQIFISHTTNDDNYANRISQSLEGEGYSIQRESSLKPESILYPRSIENVILGSAAVILVWSNSAAQSEWVERNILFAQRLKKLIVPVLIDGTALPNTQLVDTISIKQTAWKKAVEQLLPLLPAPNSTEPLIMVSEQAAHEFIRVRKEAIDQAKVMLKKNEHREAVLAILEYLAQNDPMMGVRDKAQEVLQIDSKQAPPSPSPDPRDSRHIFSVRCKNGHVNYFDKRQVCPAQATIIRGIEQRAGIELDELHLVCEECGVKVVARIDCRGYK